MNRVANIEKLAKFFKSFEQEKMRGLKIFDQKRRLTT